MITDREIANFVGEWQLAHQVVEKDYVLGWLLAAIAAHPQTRSWAFKGGTCLQQGNLLVFVVSDRGQIRSYRADRIRAVSVEPESFTPATSSSSNSLLVDAVQVQRGALCERGGVQESDQGLAQVSKPLKFAGVDEFDDAFEAATYF